MEAGGRAGDGRSRQAALLTRSDIQARYSDLAIELVLMLRLVFHLALRQAEGFVGSVLRLLGLELSVPDHTTLCGRPRRSKYSSFISRCPPLVKYPVSCALMSGL